MKKRKQNRVALKKELKNLLTKINEIENKFDQYVSKKDWLPQEEKDKVNDYLSQCSEWHKEKSDQLEETPVNKDVEFTKEEILIRIANIDDKFKALKDVKKPKSKKKIDDDEDLEEEEEKPKVEKKKAKAKKADPKPTKDNNFKLDDNFMGQVEQMKRG